MVFASGVGVVWQTWPRPHHYLAAGIPESFTSPPFFLEELVDETPRQAALATFPTGQQGWEPADVVDAAESNGLVLETRSAAVVQDDGSAIISFDYVPAPDTRVYVIATIATNPSSVSLARETNCGADDLEEPGAIACRENVVIAFRAICAGRSRNRDLEQEQALAEAIVAALATPES